MNRPVDLHYFFHFPTGEMIDIPLLLDGITLDLVPDPGPIPNIWTRLEFHRCSVCPLDPKLHDDCPIALRMATIVNTFEPYCSYEKVTVEVTDNERRYIKETTIQDGLGPLMGVVMVTAGCPVMNPLRPLVRFHLPFATTEETGFRIASMYLMAQYLKNKRGMTPDWELKGLEEIYARVAEVNKYFGYRLASATTTDASMNAIIILDCFAKAVPFAVQTSFATYEQYFEPYIVPSLPGSPPPAPGQSAPAVP